VERGPEDLYIFHGGEIGSGFGGLSLDSKGNIYGVTEHGGTANGGTVFELSPMWTKMTLYSLKGGNDGYLPLGQMNFSEMVGTTRSRVNFFMNRFKKLGFIDYHAGNEIQVHSSLLNIVLHD
jgi:uncharacterized repeat protein (TIGR03803 family)